MATRKVYKTSSSSSGGGVGRLLLGLGVGAAVAVPLSLAVDRKRRQDSAPLPVLQPVPSSGQTFEQQTGAAAMAEYAVQERLFLEALGKRDIHGAAWALNRLCVSWGQLDGLLRLSSGDPLLKQRTETWHRLADYTERLGNMR